MSVINQMLRDLDERGASEDERADLPTRLRPLPASTLRRAQPWRTLLVGMGIGALLAGGAAYFLIPGAAPPQDSTPPPPPPAAARPTPIVQTPPPVAEATPLPAEVGEMKLAELLAKAPPAAETPAPAAPAAKAAPAPVRRTAPAAAESAPAPVPVSASPAPAPAAEADGAEGHIDKRNKGGQARALAEAEYRKGMAAARRGDLAAALPPLRRALELEPTHAMARQALLSALVGGQQWPEARQVAQNGLALDPAQSGWAVVLARLQLEQREPAAALATLERHAAHGARDANYQSLLAYLLQRQQRPAEAAEHFRAALALRPSEGLWWFGLATALEAAGNADEARQAYAKAREAGNLPAEMTALIGQKLR